jgi:hypothetical protein
LARLVDGLCGSKFTVRTYTDDIKALNSTDSKKIFDALRIRIISSDLKNEPEGINGMIETVKAHPHLQAALVDLLETLPIDTLGGWVVNGWQGVIVDPGEIARFEKLLDAWSNSTKNTFLKAAATSAFKLRKK